MSQNSNELVVFLEAYANNTGLLGGGPSYAKLIAGSSFTAQLNRLSSLCSRESLSEVRISYGPQMWGPAGVEEEMRMGCPELVVTQRSFWFVDRGRHDDVQVETRQLEIKAFLKTLAQAEGPIFLGSDPTALEQAVLDDTEDDEEGEGEAFR